MKRREFLRFFLALPALAFVDVKRVVERAAELHVEPLDPEERADGIYLIDPIDSPLLAAVGRHHSTVIQEWR